MKQPADEKSTTRETPSSIASLRVLRTAKVAELLGVNRATLWRWHTSGHFPSPLVLGQGATRPVHGWREKDVNEWLATRPRLDQAEEA